MEKLELDPVCQGEMLVKLDMKGHIWGNNVTWKEGLTEFIWVKLDIKVGWG